MTLAVGAAVLSVIWLLICLFFQPIQPISALIVSGVTVVLWTAFSILTHQDEAFFLRLTGTGILFIVVWTLLTSALLLIEALPIPAGWGAIWLLWLISLALPIWVVEMEPGEVFYHRPIHHRPYRYELIGLDIKNESQAARGGDPNPADPRMPNFVRPFVVASPVMQHAAQIALNIDFIWVRPIDELRLLWKLEKRITIEETHISGIVTRDNSNFTLRVIKASALHDPRRITAPPILMLLPRLKTPAELEVILRKSLVDGIEKAARLYFISRTAGEARGEDGVLGFRNRLIGITRTLEEVAKTNSAHPEGDEIYDVFKGLKQSLGLTLVESTLNFTPSISGEEQHAANQAAARYDTARAELATTHDIIAQALEGKVDAQYLLYTRLIERGHQLHYPPPASEMPLSRDSILQRLRQMDVVKARRFAQIIVQTFPDLATLPELADLLPARRELPPSAGEASRQPLNGPVFEPNSTGLPSNSAPEPLNFDTAATHMPPPAPERVRISPDFEPNKPPTPPPDTMPEQPKQKPAPPTPPKPTFNIREAINTRPGDDGTFEPDPGSKQD